MKISIIIPVYNKEPYIKECLNSILSQDFDDFEVVAVDDGSTDASGEVCDHVAADDGRLVVVHTKNGGVTAARRKGVEISRGKYIMFVDSDDTLLSNAMKTLYDTIEETQADEVIARFIDDKGHVSPIVYKGFANVDDVIWQIVSCKHRFPVLWGSIIRRDILTDTLDTPREIIDGEDRLMQLKILTKNPKVYFSQALVYGYKIDLTNNRKDVLERDVFYDSLLRNILEPRWSVHSSVYTLHQLKKYEKYIFMGVYDVKKKYYSKVIKSLSSEIPLYDRIVWYLPPRIGHYLVRLYKKLIWLKQGTH